MKKIYTIILLIMALCVSCEFKLQPNDEDGGKIKIKRYDRLQYRYLLTADYSALQEMLTDYPMETRTLVEKMLGLGYMSHENIHKDFLIYFQDSTLQALMSDVQAQYANMDDLNKEFNEVYDELHELVPELLKPKVYTQIGALTQSIVINDMTIGVSLDKYMGVNYPLYKRFYSAEERKTMTRRYIVPDALCFYLLSLYPVKGYETRSQEERDVHFATVMWICNKAMKKQMFKTKFVDRVDRYMKKHPETTPLELLNIDDYSEF